MNTVKGTILAMSATMIMAFAVPAYAAGEAATAPAASAPTFGVVDMSKVLQVTDAAKDIFSQLEGKRKEYQGQIAHEEDTLRSAEQEIMKQKDTLSKDEFEKKRAGFEEKVIEGQKLVQTRKHTLDVAFNTSMTSLRREAAKIVADIAHDKHYSAVFTQDAVMISTPDLDMTDMVIERMNQNVKKIPIDWTAASATDDGSAAPAKASAAKKK